MPEVVETNIRDLVVPKTLSKKRHIYEALLARIRDQSLPVGARLPSAAALAAEWQVAYATVHAALQDLTRDGWLVRYPKQGTFVSSPSKKSPERSAKTAIVVMPPQNDIISCGNGNEVFEVMQGLSMGAGSTGWQIRIETIPSQPTEAEQQRALESLRSAETAIFIGEQYGSMSRRLSEEGFPVMSVMTLNDPGFGSSITYDRPMAIRLAMKHLLERGYRKIGYFGNTGEVGPAAKYPTYREIIQQEGLELREEWIGHCASHRQANERIREYLLRRPDCEAIFVANYHFASALMQKAVQFGIRVPDDLAIVANGIEGSHIDEKPLTYVRVPYLEFGIEAMKWIAARSERSGAAWNRLIKLQPELKVRASS